MNVISRCNIRAVRVVIVKYTLLIILRVILENSDPSLGQEPSYLYKINEYKKINYIKDIIKIRYIYYINNIKIIKNITNIRDIYGITSISNISGISVITDTVAQQLYCAAEVSTNNFLLFNSELLRWSKHVVQEIDIELTLTYGS